MNPELRQTIKAVKDGINTGKCPLCWGYVVDGDEDEKGEHDEFCPLGQLFEYLEEPQ